jgi:hypothetical protein
MKRSTMINGAYEIRLALKELGNFLGIHSSPDTQINSSFSIYLGKGELYNKVEAHINAGLSIFAPDVTDDENRDNLLKRIRGENPTARLKTYMHQQIALLNDFIEHNKLDEPWTITAARAHIHTYEDCLKAVQNILEDIPT